MSAKNSNFSVDTWSFKNPKVDHLVFVVFLQRSEALFNSRNYLGSAIVTFSFIFGNYCPTMD
jgi:hypothetical protein